MPPQILIPSQSPSAEMGTEDADEQEWLYQAHSKQILGARHQLSDALGLHKRVSSYKRRHMRVAIRSQNSTIAFHDHDVLDTHPMKVWTLDQLFTIRRISIGSEKALTFLSVAPESGEYFSESIYGHIGLQLEFVPAQFSAEYQSSDDAARALEGKGLCHVVYLVFGSHQNCEDWHHWFTQLILLREAAAVQRDESMNDVTDNASPSLMVDGEQFHGEDYGSSVRFKDVPLPSGTTSAAELEFQRIRSALTTTVPEKEALNTYIQGFLAGPSLLLDALPKKPPVATIWARPPTEADFHEFSLSCVLHEGEVLLSDPRHVFLGTVFLFPPQHRLRLIDSHIVCKLPLAAEFEVLITIRRRGGGGSYSSRAADENVPSTVGWVFHGSSLEKRRLIVQWFRMVKGRGREIAQTDDETFLFNSIPLNEEEDQFQRAHLEASKRRWSSHHNEEAGNTRTQEELQQIPQPILQVPTHSQEIHNKKIAVTKSYLQLRQEEEDRAWAQWEDIPTPPSRDEPPAVEENWDVCSGRIFQKFPTFYRVSVEAYIRECCAPHLVGRPNRDVAHVSRSVRRFEFTPKPKKHVATRYGGHSPPSPSSTRWNKTSERSPQRCRETSAQKFVSPMICRRGAFSSPWSLLL